MDINYEAFIKDGHCTQCGANFTVEEARASGHAHLDD